VRKRLEEIPVKKINNQRGTIRISTPEATAIDLVGYYQRAGGLEQVMTVLSELAEQIEPDNLVAAAKTAPVAWAQRLGYLLDRVGAGERVVMLKTYVKEKARDSVQLLPSAPRANTLRDPNWKLFINADLEPEL